MEFNKLPEIKNKGIQFKYFPTAMQTFIFRNWGMVDKKRIAEVLKTTVENVEKEAFRMGLGEQSDVSEWMKKGYITIIRSNWHILPYNQLLELLGWDEERFAFILKEEDFLGSKLGKFKPDCPEITYRELTESEKEMTAKIRKEVENAKAGLTDVQAPFDFWSKKSEAILKKEPDAEKVVIGDGWGIEDNTDDGTVKVMTERFCSHIKDLWNTDLSGKAYDGVIKLSFIEDKPDEYHEIIIDDSRIEIKGGNSAGILRALYRLEDLAVINGGMFFDKASYKRKPRFESRYIYSFSALYDGALDVDSRTWCPDGLLEAYAKTGVNGIWLQGILYRLTEFPFAPQISEGWEMRQKNLLNFVNRAKSYGIKIYLYINEPRSMPLSFFDKYPDMKGSEHKGYASMCIMNEKVQEYLRNAVESLCRNVSGLGGFFTITMSENQTHCRSSEFEKMCPVCKDIPHSELVALTNRLVAEGAGKVSDSINVIAWDWGWNEFTNSSDIIQKREECISKMPESVSVMCQRDVGIPFVRGGVENEVLDYSMSVDGISEITRKTWEIAKKYGHKTAVKLQINNSWECSTTPYLPIFKTLINQINDLIKTEVNHLMLSWTLGGYPSPNIRLISESFFIENGKSEIDYSFALKSLYGKDADKVKEATDLFCKAFSEFPFHIGLLYTGPQNAGVSNPLYHEPTGYKATMTCYAYDDLESWRANYSEDILEEQFKKVSDIWETGLDALDDTEGEIRDISFVSWSLFKSSYNQIRFIRLRDKYEKEKTDELRKSLLEIVRCEKELAVELYLIMNRRPEIGFEAANHYYFNADSVLEKVINCAYLEEVYK